MQKPSNPKNIHIEGLTIRYATTSNTTLTGGAALISLDCAENALIKRVKFQGNYNENKIADNNYSAIDIRGFGDAVTSENIVVDDCEFLNLYNAVKSNYDVNNIVIQNSYFNKLQRGISFNDPMSADGNTGVGPRFGRIINNKFVDIQEEAIYVGDNNSNIPTDHISMNNQFINVGNSGQNEEWSTGTSVITFLTKGNSTVNDYFDRKSWQDLNGGANTYNPLISGRAILEAESASTSVVNANDSFDLMRLPITNDSQLLKIKYKCYANLGGNDKVSRMGDATFQINSGVDPEVIISDEYNSISSDGGLYWGVTVDDVYKFYTVTIYNPSLANGGSGSDVEIEFQSHLIL
jgi:hypothetical protein